MQQVITYRTRATVLIPICLSLLVLVILCAVYFFVLPRLVPSAADILANPSQWIGLALQQKTPWFAYAPEALCTIGAVSLMLIWGLWAYGTEVTEYPPAPAPVPDPIPISDPVPTPAPAPKLLRISYLLSDGSTKKSFCIDLKTISSISGYVIGSNPKCALSIDDPTLHPEHAELRMIDKRLFIKCLTGGMKVQTGMFAANEQCKVRDGDLVLLGGVSFIFTV